MLGERPTPFDAIEFNEAIASIDVLYDLALTLSDLLMRGRADLANGLLNRYLGATRDYGGLPLMPLYLSMRGAVRAMTAASRGAVEEAARDFAFAMEALRPGPAPRLVAIGGVSGTGKSTLARSLAPRLAPPPGAIVIRSDVVRKRLSGRAAGGPAAPGGLLAGDGPQGAGADGVRCAGGAARRARSWCSTPRFSTRRRAPARSAIARRQGVRFDGIWLEISTEAAMDRVSRRAADASDATAGGREAPGRARGATCRLADRRRRAAARGGAGRRRARARRVTLAGLDRAGTGGRRGRQLLEERRNRHLAPSR